MKLNVHVDIPANALVSSRGFLKKIPDLNVTKFPQKPPVIQAHFHEILLKKCCPRKCFCHQGSN